MNRLGHTNPNQVGNFKPAKMGKFKTALTLMSEHQEIELMFRHKFGHHPTLSARMRGKLVV